MLFFFSSRRRHTRCSRDWSSDVCSSDLFGNALSTLSIFTFPLSDFQLLVAAGFLKKGFARDQPGFGAVMDGVGGLLACLIAVAPKRNRAVRAVFVDGVKVEVEGVEFCLVVLVIVCDTRHGFHAGVGR